MAAAALVCRVMLRRNLLPCLTAFCLSLAALSVNAAGAEDFAKKISVLFEEIQLPMPVDDGVKPLADEEALFDMTDLEASAVEPPAAPPLEAGAMTEPVPPAGDGVSGELWETARQAGPALVALRAWDENGLELARGCGFFVNAGGAVLTDMQIVRPEIARRIAYLTMVNAIGEPHRVTGFHWQERGGTALLQSDARETPFLELKRGFDFSRGARVSVVALDDQRGLVLAEAEAEADKSPLGAGCLNIKGENSPAEPGSPVLDTEGRVVGLVSMRVPQKGWFGFGTSVDAAASLLETRKIAKEQPMGRLAHRRFAKVSDQEPFLDAVRALGEGRHAAAAGQLARLSRAYPRSAEVWAMLGFATSKTGSKEDALNCWRKAVALDPASTRFWHQLAVSQVLSARGGENAAARESLEKAVQGRSADASTWWLLARQQVAEGQFAKAARSLEEVMARHAGYAPALYLLGYVKARLGEPANAETALLRCAKLAPRDAKPRFLLATIFAAQGRMEDAIARLREVVRMDPGHPHAWHHLARLYRKVGREAEARLTFSEFQRVARRSNQIHTTALREQEGGAK